MSDQTGPDPKSKPKSKSGSARSRLPRFHFPLKRDLERGDGSLKKLESVLDPSRDIEDLQANSIEYGAKQKEILKLIAKHSDISIDAARYQLRAAAENARTEANLTFWKRFKVEAFGLDIAAAQAALKALSDLCHEPAFVSAICNLSVHAIDHVDQIGSERVAFLNGLADDLQKLEFRADVAASIASDLQSLSGRGSGRFAKAAIRSLATQFEKITGKRPATSARRDARRRSLETSGPLFIQAALAELSVNMSLPAIGKVLERMYDTASD